MTEDEKRRILLGTYYDEWKFRNDNFWKRMIQFFVIIFFVSTFPISVSVFEGLDGIDLSGVALWVFPVAGIGLSLCLLAFCLIEGSKMFFVGVEIKIIKTEFLGEKADRTQNSYLAWLAEWKLAVLVPSLLCVLQIALAIIVLCVDL
ncbi:MAG: hypothetical protein FWE12_06115 [Oscillospiraceae bacterium]|nr:hypothetical protein [Oscillospiraceae bacterium]